jgi:hypothetical protein
VRRSGAALALGAVLVLAASAPPAASAAGASPRSRDPTPRSVVFPGSAPTYELTLRHRGPRHLRLELQASTDGLLVLSVRGHDRINVYIAQARVSATGGIHARLGHLGRLALRFAARGRARRNQAFPGCRGKPELTQPGDFAGLLAFRGESGFFTARVHRARGSVVTTHAVRCPGGGDGRGGSESEAEAGEAVLDASTPSGGIDFLAAGSHRGTIAGASIFVASQSRQLGPVRELRAAFTVNRALRAFEFDDALTTATVRPGGPFRGTATFQREPGGAGVWTGSLRAAFFGGGVALTGGRIEASLERPRTDGSFTGSVSRSLRRVGGRMLSIP